MMLTIGMPVCSYSTLSACRSDASPSGDAALFACLELLGWVCCSYAAAQPFLFSPSPQLQFLLPFSCLIKIFIVYLPSKRIPKSKTADEGTTHTLCRLGMASLLRRLPEHDRRSHPMGCDPHQVVHHLCRAKTVFLPKLYPRARTERTGSRIRLFTDIEK